VSHFARWASVGCDEAVHPFDRESDHRCTHAKNCSHAKTPRRKGLSFGSLRETLCFKRSTPLLRHRIPLPLSVRTYIFLPLRLCVSHFARWASVRCGKAVHPTPSSAHPTTAICPNLNLLSFASWRLCVSHFARWALSRARLTNFSDEIASVRVLLARSSLRSGICQKCSSVSLPYEVC
jgi:hypothetical protein